ncbi:MAG: hypothetical protein IE931_06230 [Sphingobacteriales bacterium]|nr:hypothetical protein [Sphingobacteriales bacterium]
MFNKINQWLQENVKNEVFLNAGIAKDSVEAVISEASGAVIDVLKSQLDSGKAKDLMSFFKGKKSEQEVLLKMMVKKYANRLNKYHAVAPAKAEELAKVVIPVAMKKCIAETTTDVKQEKGIFALLNWLSGNTVNFENFFLRMDYLQIA